MRLKLRGSVSQDHEILEIVENSGVAATLNESGLANDRILSLALSSSGGAAANIEGFYTLAQAVTAGDATFTLDRNPAWSSTGAGLFLVDPHSTSPDLLRVTTVGGTVVTPTTSTLATHKTAEFISSTKTIRFNRPITSIVGNGATTTVTTATAHQLVSSATVVISGTVNWRDPSSASFPLVTGAITVTGATTFTFASTVNATESVGWSVDSNVAWNLNRAYVGRAYVITASVSNNKVVTIASIVRRGSNGPFSEITVNESLIDENAGNTIVVTRQIGHSHSSGTPVFWIDAGLIPWTWYGAKSGSNSFSTANTTAFNRLSQQIYDVSTACGIQVPAGNWYVDGELKMERDQVVEGVGVQSSQILSHTTFPFDATGEVALLHPKRDGQPTTYGIPSASGRWTARKLLLNCQQISNSNGFLTSPQQPDEMASLRLDGSRGLYGLCLTDVQDCKLYNIELIDNTVPLRYHGATMVRIYGLNIEQTQGSSMVILEQGSINNSFYGVHLEHDLETIAFDVRDSSTNFGFYDLNYSNPSTGTLFKFDTPTANPGAKCRYVLSDVFAAANSATFKIVDDVQRSITITSDTADSNRSIQFAAAQDDVAFFLIPSGLRFYGAGGMIEYGSAGPKEMYGSGSPEGAKAAPVGSTYRRTNGGAGTSFYVKESGTGNTGWVGK